MIDLWIKALLRFPANIGRANEYLSNKKPESAPAAAASPIVLDLHTPQMLFDSGRHPACLAISARLSGSPVVLRCSRLLLAEFSRKQFGEALLSDPGVTWVSPGTSIQDHTLVLYDTIKPPADLPATANAFRMMIGRDVVSGVPVMPYPMHPTTLSKIQRHDLASLRESQRSVKLFFAGLQQERYGRSRIETAFGVQSRISLLNVLRQHRGQRVRPTLKNADRDSMIVVNSQTDPIAADQWFTTLAKTDFFLCCPGAAQPMCHNVVEAMSVGAIPLIEYGDRFTPHLTDGVNAVCFRGKPDLKKTLDRIDQMTEDRIHTIRGNVVKYYEEHLRGDRFLAGLRDGQTDSASGWISMPFNDKNFFRGPAIARAA